MNKNLRLIPLIERVPTKVETLQFCLAMSSFRDGSGQERDKDGLTRPGWRDLERVVAEILNGFAPENKDIFDIIVQSNKDSSKFFGISLKSKELSRKAALDDLRETGRVHMEIANSPAKFWAVLRAKGITEKDFLNKRKAEIIGPLLLEIVESWHKEAADRFNHKNPGKFIDLEKSVYMTISYSKPRTHQPRLYQLHTFDLRFPGKIKWKYISSRCIRGYDPLTPSQTLVEWYGLSGGQFKYYPCAKESRFHSESFKLLLPQKISIKDRAKNYWKGIWKD